MSRLDQSPRTCNWCAASAAAANPARMNPSGQARTSVRPRTRDATPAGSVGIAAGLPIG